MFSKKELDEYMGNISSRVQDGRLPPEDIQIVEMYNEYKAYKEIGTVKEFKELVEGR